MNRMVFKLKNVSKGHTVHRLVLFVLFFGLTSATTNDQSGIQRIARAASYIQNYYYDSQRIHPERMMREGFIFLAKLVPELLVQFPESNPRELLVSVGDQSQKIEIGPINKLSDILEPVSQVFAFVESHLREKGKLARQTSSETKPEEREYAFINGMLEKLDPHSNLLPPKAYEEFKTQTEGEYGGLGIVIGMKDEELTVIAPLDGTPAMKAGIKAEDKILQIDDLSTTNLPLQDAVDKLRGKINTKVTLIIQRKNQEPFEITLIRKKIVIQSVKSKLVVKEGKKIGIVRLIGFQEDTFADFLKNLDQLYEQAKGKVDGLILDMRNNPGGLLDQSIEIADAFLTTGDIVATSGRATGEEVSKARLQGNEITAPVVVLVNGGSASASEIVAGALKGNKRAVVMGTRTFGKGSVQQLFPQKDGSSLKLTVAEYLTPGRISIQAVGITPDIQLLPVHVDQDFFDLREDEPFGEKSFDEHLESARVIGETKPFFTLPFLEKEKKKEEEERESELTTPIDETNDLALKLAVQFLSKSETGAKQKMLEAALPFLKEETKTQDNLITTALVQKGIHWEETLSQGGLTNLSYTSEIVKKSSPEPLTEFPAGEEVVWQVTAYNKGPDPVVRLIGVVESEHPLLKEREFVFGKIPGGGSKTAEIPIKIPKETLSFEEQATIRFFSSHQQLLQPYPVFLRMTEKPKPSFAYSFKVRDDGTLGSTGNGNHIPEKGETVVLDLTIKNQNLHSAEETVANIKNEEGEGIFLKEGRSVVGMIPGQGEKEAKLVFKISPDFPKEKMKLKLTILDRATRTVMSDTLVFPLRSENAAIFDPPASQLQAPPLIEIVSTSISLDRLSMSLSGFVLDDHKISDVMIFASGEKTYYKSIPAPSDSSSSHKFLFEAAVPLKEGANVITIEARDNREMVTQQNMLVVGTPKKSYLSQTQ